MDLEFITFRNFLGTFISKDFHGIFQEISGISGSLGETFKIFIEVGRKVVGLVLVKINSFRRRSKKSSFGSSIKWIL